MLFFRPFIRPLARLNDELRDPLCKNRFGKSIALTLGQSALVGAGLVTTGIVVGGASSVASRPINQLSKTAEGRECIKECFLWGAWTGTGVLLSPFAILFFPAVMNSIINQNKSLEKQVKDCLEQTASPSPKI